MITSKQVLLARTMLDMSQQDLASTLGWAHQTVSKIEKGTVNPPSSRMRTLQDFFEAMGIEFLPADGICCPDKKLIELNGENWFLDLLTDAYNTLKDEDNAEILIFGANDEVSPPAVIEAYRKLKNAGVRIRQMVKEDNLYLHNDEDDYRCIPEEYYENLTTVIYSNKVCVDFSGSGALLVSDKWARAERLKYEYMWSVGKKVNGKSVAPERF